jgi:hypothetical protein
MEEIEKLGNEMAALVKVRALSRQKTQKPFSVR